VTPLFVWKAGAARASAMLSPRWRRSHRHAVGVRPSAAAVVGRSLDRVALRRAWMRGVVLPVLGPQAAVAFADRLGPLLVPLGTSPVPSAVVTSWLLLGTLSLVVAILALGVPRHVRWWLAGSYALVTLGSFAGALGGTRALLGGIEGGARYGFVPGVLMLWLLVLNVRPDRRMQSLVCATLVAAGVGTGAWHWRQTLRVRGSWPAWSAEVMVWKLTEHAAPDLAAWVDHATRAAPVTGQLRSAHAPSGAHVEALAVPGAGDDAAGVDIGIVERTAEVRAHGRETTPCSVDLDLARALR
jgi:hypothetical protein